MIKLKTKILQKLETLKTAQVAQKAVPKFN